MLLRVDDQLGSISASLRDAVERSDEMTSRSGTEREQIADLDAGLERAAHRIERYERGVGGRPLAYAAELEREIAKAGAVQRPLTLVLIAVHQRTGSHDVERAATEIAALLERVTRMGDIIVRRSPEEIGVLLPATTVEGGRRFDDRLRAELEASVDPHARSVVSIGIAEWKPGETGTSFDARAHAAVERDGVQPLERSGDAFDLPEAR